jgi:cell division protein FtsL
MERDEKIFYYGMVAVTIILAIGIFYAVCSCI